MSKKSRRRNKKILGVLGALGAAALLGRNKGTAAADVDSGRGGDSSSAVARAIANAPKGTKYPGVNKAVVAAPIKKTKTLASPKWNKMDVSEVTIPEPTKVTPWVSKKSSPSWNNMDTSEVTIPESKKVTTWIKKKAPTRTYSEFGLSPFAAKKGGRAGHKSGGRVKLAKRGLGRAFTKSKK